MSVPEDARAIIKPWNEREDTEKHADSGVDDQLVIHVPFSQNVRVRSLILKLGNLVLLPYAFPSCVQLTYVKRERRIHTPTLAHIRKSYKYCRLCRSGYNKAASEHNSTRRGDGCHRIPTPCCGIRKCFLVVFTFRKYHLVKNTIVLLPHPLA